MPRIADKARAFDAGTLGNYLYGQSPIDDAFLRASRLDYASFLELVRHEPDDAAVLAAIERASPGATQRLRAWSGKARLKLAWFFGLLDLDDGYESPRWMTLAAPVVRGTAFVVSRMARALRASPKVEPQSTAGVHADGVSRTEIITKGSSAPPTDA